MTTDKIYGSLQKMDGCIREFIILKSWEKCNRNIAMGIELNQNDKKSVNIQN